MDKISIRNKDFHIYADKKARMAMLQYSCEPKDLLAPLVDIEFNLPEKSKRITVEVKYNNHRKGNFVIQPTLVNDQKWFVMTFTNLLNKPEPLHENKYRVQLTCGHTLIVDTTVDDLFSTAYYDCHVCSKKG